MSNEHSNANEPVTMSVRFKNSDKSDSVRIERRLGLEFIGCFEAGKYRSLSHATCDGGVYSLKFEDVQRISIEPPAQSIDLNL